jgi:hypothetical protein
LRQLQKESTLLFPPHPIVPEEGWGNWPCKEVNKVDPFENLPQYVFAPVDDESDEHVEDEDEVDEDDSKEHNNKKICFLFSPMFFNIFHMEKKNIFRRRIFNKIRGKHYRLPLLI